MLDVIRSHPNICQSIHLPVQSGSDSCLRRMNRPYTRDAFLRLVDQIRTTLPQCSLSTDVITGFCGETEAEHAETVSLMEQVGFDHAFMYLFSMRENTFAWRHFQDDVPLAVKKRRLTEIQDAFYSTLKKKLPALTGTPQLVLVEGESKHSKHSQHSQHSQHGKEGRRQLKGRCEGDRMCVFDGRTRAGVTA